MVEVTQMFLQCRGRQGKDNGQQEVELEKPPNKGSTGSQHHANDRVLRKIKETASFSTVEESLQQTSVARSGSPHNALHSLVYLYIQMLLSCGRSTQKCWVQTTSQVNIFRVYIFTGALAHILQYIIIIGASLSEPHSRELNGDFL